MLVSARSLAVSPWSGVCVDTDMILPATFLKTVSRQGLGRGLFHSARFGSGGHERPDFILNKEPWCHSQILVALENFGCGSSRVHAPWALLDFGIRCIVAPSFAEIFYANCFKNAILPIVLPRIQIDLLMDDTGQSSRCRLDIDLEAQTVTRSAGDTISFDIDVRKKARLLQGLDDIGKYAGPRLRYCAIRQDRST
jgi:3-isopropylmalate/(R)-2-methylmalate dehydratase small subunit